MQNDQGQIMDLYIPRKCSWTNKILASNDYGSVQFNVGHVDPKTGKRDSKKDKDKDKYILSNIISDGKYYSTIKDLFDMSDYHKEWIKKEDGTEIINRVTPEWLESTSDKEGLYELLNEKEEQQKEKQSMLDNIEKQRKEESIIVDELEIILKEKLLIQEKLEGLED